MLVGDLTLIHFYLLHATRYSASALNKIETLDDLRDTYKQAYLSSNALYAYSKS